MVLRGECSWSKHFLTHSDCCPPSSTSGHLSCSIILMILSRAESSYVVHSRVSAQAWQVFDPVDATGSGIKYQLQLKAGEVLK